MPEESWYKKSTKRLEECHCHSDIQERQNVQNWAIIDQFPWLVYAARSLPAISRNIFYLVSTTCWQTANMEKKLWSTTPYFSQWTSIRSLGFLRHNLRISNEQAKSAAHFIMVRPIIDYCSIVWNPHTKENVNKVDMVQQRAARNFTNRYCNTISVISLLDHLDWKSSEVLHAKTAHHAFKNITRISGHTSRWLSCISFNQDRLLTLIEISPDHCIQRLLQVQLFAQTACRWNSNVAEVPSLSI